MAKSFLTDIQLNGNVLLKGKIQAWGGTPNNLQYPDGSTLSTVTGAVEGVISSYQGLLYIYKGTPGSGGAWTQVGTGTVTSVTGTSPIASSGGATPAISLASGYGDTQNPYASKTANFVLAAPNGASGVPTFRALVAADIPTLNQNTTGSAAKWTSAVNLAGNSVDGSAPVAFANKFIVQGTTDTGLTGAQFLGALGTGILKNTTTTGVLSIAVAGDFPTLNQNTTGSAGSTTGTLTFGTGLTAGGASFNGSANVTITPVSATTSVAGIVQLSDSTSTTGSTKAATETAVKAAYDRGSTGVTNAATAQSTADAALPKAGGTMTGYIVTHADPVSDLQVANKRYVDTVSAGINVHEAVKYATTGALGTAGNLVGGTITTTYANGTSGLNATITVATSSNWTAITIDGQSLTVTDRVLIKDQAANLQNGIYTVTQVGSVGNTTSFIFTRAVDNDQSPEIDAGDLTYVIAGTTNGGDGYVQTTNSVTVGTTGVVWTQFSGAGVVPLATTSSVGIASFPTAQFSVDGNGAVTIGTVNPSVVNNASSGQISGARGGTGVDNTGKTITLGGNLTTSGAFATTLTVTATTNATLPAGSTTLLATNGSGSSLTFGTGSLSLAGNLTTSGAFATTLTSTATTNATLPAGTVTLVDLASSQALTNKTYNGLTISGSAGTLTIPTGSTLATTGAFSTTFASSATTTVTLPSTSSTMARTDAAQTFTGTQTFTTISSPTSASLALVGANQTGTDGRGITLTGGNSSYALGIASGGSVSVTAGNHTGNNTGLGSSGGSISISAGNSTTATDGVGGNVILSAGTGTAANGSVNLNGIVKLPNVANSTAGFIKTATDGTLSRSASVAYSELPTNVGRVSRTVTGSGTGSGTSIAVTHGLGTNLLNAQLFDTGTVAGTATLVEVDVASTSTTTTFTFASSQTLTNYSYVITG